MLGHAETVGAGPGRCKATRAEEPQVSPLLRRAHGGARTRNAGSPAGPPASSLAAALGVALRQVRLVHAGLRQVRIHHAPDLDEAAWHVVARATARGHPRGVLSSAPPPILRARAQEHPDR